jgi:hypothetical protein
VAKARVVEFLLIHRYFAIPVRVGISPDLVRSILSRIREDLSSCGIVLPELSERKKAILNRRVSGPAFVLELFRVAAII